MRDYHIALIEADGIGREVVPEAVATIQKAAQRDSAFRFTFESFDWGTERYLRDGALMPADALKTLESGGFDALLVGPVGDPRVPDHITLWGLLLPIRQAFDQYVNLAAHEAA